MSKLQFLISPTYPGLGDHLFYSALPQLLKARYPDCSVYLDSLTNFRSWQIYNLVWELNPYLDGVSDSRMMEYIAPKRVANGAHKQIMTNICEQFVGEIDVEPLPEVYLPKKTLSEHPKFIIDLNYISFVGAVTKNNVLALANEIHSDAHIVNPPKWALPYFDNSRIFRTTSLIDYAYLIMNSQEFICFASGGATLASALRNNTIVYHGRGFDKRLYHRNNEYRLICTPESRYISYAISEYLLHRNERRVERFEKQQTVESPPPSYIKKILRKIYVPIIAYSRLRTLKIIIGKVFYELDYAMLAMCRQNHKKL